MISSPCRLSRRRSAILVLLLALAGCAAACGDGATSSEPVAQMEDVASASSVEPVSNGAGDTVPTIEPPPEAVVQLGPAEPEMVIETDPLIYVVPQDVTQGHVFLVAVDAPGAGFASVAYNGEIFTLLREGDRLFAILPVEARTLPGPIPLVIAVADNAGRQALRLETTITVTEATVTTEVIQLDESNQALLDPAVIGEDQEIRDAVQRALTPERHWSGRFGQPAAGVITSSFGLLRSYNFQEPNEYHTGLDLAGDHGDPVLAPNAGVVAWVGRTQRRGNSVIVDHGGGVHSGYYHLSEVLVTEGTVVVTGDPLGSIGATGLATGPHLHWEIVVHGIPVNPGQWIREQEIPDPEGALDPEFAIGDSGP